MVDAVERPRDQTTGMAKGFAFITFKDPAVVETIVGQRWLTLPNGARIECKDWLFMLFFCDCHYKNDFIYVKTNR